MRYIPLVLWLLVGQALAQSNCPGFEPHAPPGCTGPPVCLCDADGRACGWTFVCDRGER